MQEDKKAGAALNGWLGIQEKMVKGWWDVLAQPQQNGHSASTPNSLWDVWLSQWSGQGLAQWQSLYGKNLAALSQQIMPEVSKSVMAQFLKSQEQAQLLSQMVTEAWQAMLTNATSPDEWQSALTAFIEQLRQQMMVATDRAKLLKNSAELWRLYYEEAQKFAQPWLTAWRQTPTFMNKLGSTDRAAATNELMQFYQTAFEQTIGRVLMAPSIGLLREFNEKASKGFDLWLENQQTQMAYQLLVGEAWLDAFQALMQKLVAMAQKGETLVDQRHLLRIWVDVADEVFIELFHSDAYAQAQSAYVNSNMTLRRQQRELLEVWLRSNDMPTRTDVDEAHHQIYQLRKEVKALKNALAAHEAAPAATKPAPRPPAKGRTGASGKAKASTTTAVTKSVETPTQGEENSSDSGETRQEGAA